MSENTGVMENEVDAGENDEDDGDGVARINKGDVNLILSKIDGGRHAGFKFWKKEFKSLEGAVEHFTQLSKTGKTGDQIVLGLLNSSIAFRARNQATSKLIVPPKATNEEKKAFIAEREAWLKDDEKSILVSEDDAMNYIPGEREVSSIAGFTRQKNEILKLMKQFKAAGNIPAAKEQYVKYNEVCEQIKKLQEEEEQDILASLGED